MEELLNSWLDTGAVLELFNPQSLVYLVVVILVFYVAKKVNDLLTPYNLNEQLTKEDNKAIAVSFMGYLAGVGIVIWGVISSPSVAVEGQSVYMALGLDLLSTLIWSVIGIVLLQLARFINDKALLYQFDNVKELVEDQNVGTGIVQCGSYIGSALIIFACITGEGTGNFLITLLDTLVYFVCGQLAFILFSKLYQKVSRYDLHKEIEADNAAAGVSFGMTLIAVGILMSRFILFNHSLVKLAVWLVIGSLLLIVCRYLVDKFILPGSLLDEEVSRDRNWGAALVEGISAIMLAIILTSIF